MFGKTKKPRLEIGKLLERMGPESNAAEISAVLYVKESTVRKWMRKPHTNIDPFVADSLASRIGKHPFQIWDWDWVDTK